MKPASTTTKQAPKLALIDELGSTMKQLLSPDDHEMMADGQIRTLITDIEQWADAYQRSMKSGVAISMEEIEMLKKTRAELAHILHQRLTLEDEGGLSANKQQEERMDHVAAAISRIDQVLPHAEGYAAASAAPARKRA